jgi:hypothetical protein
MGKSRYSKTAVVVDHGTAGSRRAAPRRRGIRLLLTASVLLLSCAVVGVGEGATAGPAAAAGPLCSFSSTTPGVKSISVLVINVVPGADVTFNCTGFPASHPYLLVEASLLVAVDPAAKPLLTGQATSVPGLLAIIAALPELNALSVAFPSSDASGNLNYHYTVPSTQPLDPNATCPPTTQELNSGLIGCALAMIDLTSFQPVTPGTAVLSYKGQPVFPPAPTLALTPNVAHVGQWVSLGDVPGAQTFWWVATLASVFAGLSGGGGAGPIPVEVKIGARKAVTNGAGVTPASYNGTVFTPPKLGGTFFAKKKGRPTVNVALFATLAGFTLSNHAIAKLRVLR